MLGLFIDLLDGVVNWLNSISVLGVSMFDFIMGFVIVGIIFSFLRGGSND